MRDRFNREITYLRISVTDRCNLRCVYCSTHKEFNPLSHEDILSYEQIRDIVSEAASLGISKVRLTGGEPLVRRDIETLVLYIAGIQGIEELCMTTNGTRLSTFAPVLKENGLNRLNISLDTLDREKFRQITGRDMIEKVLSGIEATIRAGFENTKINMVVIPGVNDNETERMKDFCSKKELTLQLIRQFELSDSSGSVSSIIYDRPPPCSQCNRIRLMADGHLKPCLFSDIEIPVEFTDISASIKKVIMAKPESGTVCTTRSMNQIGG